MALIISNPDLEQGLPAYALGRDANWRKINDTPKLKK